MPTLSQVFGPDDARDASATAAQHDALDGFWLLEMTGTGDNIRVCAVRSCDGPKIAEVKRAGDLWYLVCFGRPSAPAWFHTLDDALSWLHFVADTATQAVTE